MEDQIIAKLRRELERPITAESLVDYLLVEVRKLMDRKGLQYDTLRLCCNWVAHVKLSGDAARRIVTHVDVLYPTGNRTGHCRLSLKCNAIRQNSRNEAGSLKALHMPK